MITDEKIFSEINFPIEKVKINQVGKTSRVEIKIKRPAWYERPKVRINYSNGMFQQMGMNFFYVMNSYPFAIDLINQITYEVPSEKLQSVNELLGNDFLNSNEPAYSCSGIIQESNEIAFVCQTLSTKRLFLLRFRKNGNFLSFKEYSNIGNKLLLTNGSKVYIYGKWGDNYYLKNLTL